MSRLSSCLQSRAVLSLRDAKTGFDGFAVAVSTTSKLNYCILAEIETGAMDRDTRENTNRRQSVFPRCQQVLTPSE